MAVITETLGPLKAFSLAFKNYGNFSGRSRRSEFFWVVLTFWLFNTCLLVPLAMAIAASTGSLESLLVFDLIWYGAVIIPLYGSLWVRRFHDMGWPGAIAVIPLGAGAAANFAAYGDLSVSDAQGFQALAGLVSIVFLLIMSKKSQEGSNEHGPDPRFAGNAIGGSVPSAPSPTPSPTPSAPVSPAGFSPQNPVFPSSPDPSPPAPENGIPPGLGLTESSDDDCPECGISVPGDEPICPVCGYNLVDCVTLSANGKSITIRSQMEFGNRNLSALVGEDAKYMSSAQFTILKIDGKGWMAVGSQSAKNATYLNGTPMPDGGVALSEGDILSLKNDAAKMVVTFGVPEK